MGKVIKSVDKALQVLELFLAQKSELGVTEISNELNFYKSTVHNIITTLENRKFLEKNEKTDKYRLSLKCFKLGNIVVKNMKLRQIALPYINKISKKYDETVHLGILSKNEVLSIEHTESTHTLRSQIITGETAPLHCTAVGKAILAYQSEEKISEVINEGLQKHTDNTITDPKKLRKELTAIREQGYAIDDEEHEYGVRCVAAPIRDIEGEVKSSMSISGPGARLSLEKLERMSSRIKEACEEISSQLGYLESITN